MQTTEHLENFSRRSADAVFRGERLMDGKDSVWLWLSHRSFKWRSLPGIEWWPTRQRLVLLNITGPAFQKQTRPATHSLPLPSYIQPAAKISLPSSSPPLLLSSQPSSPTLFQLRYWAQTFVVPGHLILTSN